MWRQQYSDPTPRMVLKTPLHLGLPAVDFVTFAKDPSPTTLPKR